MEDPADEELREIAGALAATMRIRVTDPWASNEVEATEATVELLRQKLRRPPDGAGAPGWSETVREMRADPGFHAFVSWEPPEAVDPDLGPRIHVLPGATPEELERARREHERAGAG